MDKRLLEILCCPATRQPLRALRRDEVDALNRAVAAGEVHTVGGRVLDAAAQAGLLTSDRKLIYRIEDDIPVMLVEEGISSAQVRDFPAQ